MKPLLISILLTLLLTACREDNLPPVARCESYPVTSDTTVLFQFDASKSVDDNGLKVALSYRWDFDGDSMWDTDYRIESSIGHYFINPGTYLVNVEVRDFDGLSDTASTSITVFGRNKVFGTMIDPRDGQTYRIVKLKDSWWMTENLRYGNIIDSGVEQTDNGIVEMYRMNLDINDDTIGGIYRWQEAMNFNLNSNQGICPPGWNIPTNQEWEDLSEGLPKFYAVRYFGKDGFSGLNLDVSNKLYRYMGEMQSYAYLNGFWSSSYRRSENLSDPGFIIFDWESKSISNGFLVKSGPENNTKSVHYFTVRCMKD